MQNRMRELLRFEIQRHQALASLASLPQIADAHLEVVEVLQKTLQTQAISAQKQPKRVAVKKCSRKGL